MDTTELLKILNNVPKGNMLPWWNYLVILITAGIGAYFGSYLMKKGENLATHEDIKDITSTVETVKKQFIEQTEELKADLHVIAQTENDYLKEKRETYLIFLDKSINWFHLCMDFRLEALIFYNKDFSKANKTTFY